MDNLYLINGHFTESIKGLLKDESNHMEKMRIVFTEDSKKSESGKINALDHIAISY